MARAIEDGGVCVAEHRALEPDAFAQIFDRDMDVHALHGLSTQQFGSMLAAHVAPTQQFSVGKPIRPFMAWKFAV